MDPVGRITFLDEPPYQGKYRLVQLDYIPFSVGDMFTVVDKSDEYNVVVSPADGIHRCDGCVLKPDSLYSDIMDCSCCTEDGWFPCVCISRGMKFSDYFIFKPTSGLMEEL